MTSRTNINEDERIDNFLLTTTFHGLHKVAPSRSNRSRRYIWLCIVFLHLLGFSGHLSWLVSRYLSYPVITKQSQGVIRASFPDVTICFNSHFRGSKEQTKLKELGNQTFKNAENNAKLFWQTALKREFPSLDETSIKNMLYRVQINSMMPYAVTNGIIQTLEELMICCWLNEVYKCPQSEIFVSIIHPRKGSCLTFESTDSVLVSNRSFADNIHKLDLLFGQLPDDLEYGVDYSLSFSKFVRGLTLILHSPGTYPIGTEHASNIGLGSTVEVKMTSIVQDDTPSNPCEPSTRLLEVWQPYQQSVRKYVYNSILCNELEIQKKIKSSCQCISEELPLPNEEAFKSNVSYCHELKEDILGSDNLEQINGSLFIKMGNNSEPMSLEKYLENSNVVENMACHEKILNTMLSTENCPVKCSRFEYGSSSFYEEYPFVVPAIRTSIPNFIQQKIEEQLALNKSIAILKEFIPFNIILSKNIQRVGIRLSSLMGDLMTQKSAYSIGNLFSDIGGIFGLWIGCSIITILELSEFSISIANSKRNIRIASASRNGTSHGNSAISLEPSQTNDETKNKSTLDQPT